MTTYDLNLDLIPLEKDVFSMEISECYRKLVMNKDMSILRQVEDSLFFMQEIYGRIPYIFSIGDNAKVYENLMQYQQAKK